MKTHVATAVVSLALFASNAYADGDLEFHARLSGDQEVPPVSTRATGKASFEVDDDFAKLEYKLTVKTRGGVGLLGAAGAHIHCAQAGQNGPVVAFLAGVVNGGLDGKVKFSATLTDANIINPACGATIVDLANSMASGLTYVNVHSRANPSGEVRGQILPSDD